ncbi:MAG: twin-arginine translocase subunit TatC [Deltaproteobacteria bacterium]|nr:twin-arginine translocase subunit TatC [Deltaproteobacteria bacterium]
MAEDKHMLPLALHLRELRKRLIRSAVAALAGFLVCYYYSKELYDLLARPLIPAMPEGSAFLAFTGVTEPFVVYMKVGLAGGIILGSPIILYEIWAFVAPGLYKTEKRLFIAIIASSLVLFAAGVVFAYLAVFPFAFKYLMSYSSAGLKPFISMDGYFSLATKLLIAFGFVFQLPLAMLVASRLGLVGARQFLSWWRYAIVAIFVAAAILTPTPDAFNQLLMAGPLVVLYGTGVLAAWLFGGKK